MAKNFEKFLLELIIFIFLRNIYIYTHRIRYRRSFSLRERKRELIAKNFEKFPLELIYIYLYIYTRRIRCRRLFSHRLFSEREREKEKEINQSRRKIRRGKEF